MACKLVQRTSLQVAWWVLGQSGQESLLGHLCLISNLPILEGNTKLKHSSVSVDNNKQNASIFAARPFSLTGCPGIWVTLASTGLEEKETKTLEKEDWIWKLASLGEEFVFCIQDSLAPWRQRATKVQVRWTHGCFEVVEGWDVSISSATFLWHNLLAELHLSLDRNTWYWQGNFYSNSANRYFLFYLFITFYVCILWRWIMHIYFTEVENKQNSKIKHHIRARQWWSVLAV